MTHKLFDRFVVHRREEGSMSLSVEAFLKQRSKKIKESVPKYIDTIANEGKGGAGASGKPSAARKL